MRHPICHRPILHKDLCYQAYASSGELTPDWNEILPDAHHLKTANLSVFEKAHLKDFEFRYLTIKKRGKIAGLVYFQILHFKKDHYKSLTTNSPLLEKIEDAVLNRDLKIFATGNFLRVNFPGIYVFENKLNADEVITCIEHYIQSLKRSQRPTLLILKDLKDNEELGGTMKHFGYRHFPEDIAMELKIRREWESFDDYVGALSKKYVQRIRKTRESFKQVRRIELSEEEIYENREKINKLYHQIMSKQTIRLGLIDADYLLACKRHSPVNFKVFAYYLNDELIAFTSNIIYRNKWEVHYIGMNNHYNNQYKIYLNILLDGIKDAINNKKHSLELGRTAREAKAICGCEPVYFTNYYKVKGPVAKLIFKLLEKNFKDNEGDEWKKRNPFKEVKKEQEVVV